MADFTLLPKESFPEVFEVIARDGWIAIEMSIPIPVGGPAVEDRMVLNVYAKIEGNKLIRCTTVVPPCFSGGREATEAEKLITG